MNRCKFCNDKGTERCIHPSFNINKSFGIQSSFTKFQDGNCRLCKGKGIKSCEFCRGKQKARKQHEEEY